MDSANSQLGTCHQPVLHRLWGQGKTMIENSIYTEFLTAPFLMLNRIVSAKDIYDIYGSLWRIDETFKVTKTGMLELRPVSHSLEDRIKAHFLLCFISSSVSFPPLFHFLVLERVLEHKLDPAFSSKRIANSLSQICGARLPNTNIFHFSYDEVLACIGKEFEIDFAWAYRRTSDINEMITKMKIYEG